MPLNPDDTLLNDQYRILRLLGRGGFGFVYQAQDTLLHREIAIKELIPALVGDEATLKRFLVEARATMELAHEHIVRTHNVFQEGGNYYIVMECMSGGSLEERLRAKGSLPVDEAVRIAAEVCAGLDHAHQHGIVHCDLKPANILFASNGSAKVADFGIAHVSEQMLSRSWMTPAGFVAGTLPYMSPEQADGVREDPRVDVYALGAVLYRMLTGRTYLDFDQRETPGAQADNVYRIRNAKPDPPSAHNRRIPAWLDDVVLKALSKRPEERYGAAAEMQSALKRRGAALPVPSQAEASAPVTPSRPRPAHRPAWFWPAVGAAGVLLIAIAVALALLFGGGPGPPQTRTPEPTQMAAVEPSATFTLTPTHTSPPPTSTATPTDTSRPAASPTPSSTSAPDRSPSTTPTRTPIAPPTKTSEPANTPIPAPTITPKPTNTPLPSPVPTPTGPGRIAFTSDRDGDFEIYVMSTDGGEVTRLTDHPMEDWSPAWSPDGRRIAFDSNRDGNWEIYIMNTDGSGVTRLTNHSAKDRSPRWSPDGKRIAFESDRDYNWEIYIMNADGSGQTNLTKSPNTERYPAWSPDGKRIAYSGGSWEIYIMNADGSGQTPLTMSPNGGALAPAWSPDGKRIAFELFTYSPTSYEIRVMNADGSESISLITNPAVYSRPAWSPDGRHIAFSANPDGNHEIYIMSANGSGVTRLTNDPAHDRDPAWSP